MRKRSRLSDEATESCRWWDCSAKWMVEWTFEGGPKCEEQALPGTKPVINQGCMLVHGKWTVGQFEWHRDYNWIITVSGKYA